MPADLPTARYDRRRFLQRGGLLAAGLAVTARTRPAFGLVRSGRPELANGVQSGDVTAGRAVVWARADRPARLVVEVAPTESFTRPRLVPGPVATEATDFTAQVDLRGLPPGQDVFYRVHFADLDDPTLVGAPQAGRFRTAPDRPDDVSFTWGGDTAGQGWGINPDFGGMRIYETMRQARPDFFVHSGDTIYADGPLAETVPLPDGTVWRNLVTPEKAKVAETLDEFRGNHRYNLLDEHVRRFNAEVPILAQWDDHETTNNWYPGEVLEDPRYTVTDVDVLAARARQAFLEYLPLREHGVRDGRIYRTVSHGPLLDLFLVDMRTYRGPNTANDQPGRGEVTQILGRRQLRWLQRELQRSTATWKVICSDLPIGLIVPDGEAAMEGVANRDGGGPRGRELEIAQLLSFIARQDIGNVVWITADVHYTAAHHYDPARAAFGDFKPFWEFVSGPLHAGTFGPNPLDPTFGPQVVYQRVADVPNQPPSAGLQFFGQVAIAGDTGVMTVRLRDLAGATLYEVALDPAS